MTVIKAIDFYGLAHAILGARPDSDSDIRSLWESATTQAVDNHTQVQPLLLVDSKPYWRTLVFPEYKANRPTYRDPLFNDIVRIGLASSCPKLQVDGLEADDLAGLLVKHHCNKGGVNKPYLYLVSTDTDWCQLVSDEHKVTWVNFGQHLPQVRHERQVLDWAYKRHDILMTNVTQIVRLKHCLGDTSDNLPPYLGTDLISLQGCEWLHQLELAGYNLTELFSLVKDTYEQFTTRTRVSLSSTVSHY